MLGKLTQDKIENILSSQVLGRLGCTDGTHPYITPVSLYYDGKQLYGQTMKLQRVLTADGLQ